MLPSALIFKCGMLPLTRHLTKATIHTSGIANAKVALVRNKTFIALDLVTGVDHKNIDCVSVSVTQCELAHL